MNASRSTHVKIAILSLMTGALMFGKGASADPIGKNFGLPMIFEQSNYYYIPLNLPERSSNLSYSAIGGDSIGVASYGLRLSRCNCENIFIVDKKTLKKKALLEQSAVIDTFVLLDPKTTRARPELSKLIHFFWREKDGSPRRFSVANLDGTEMKTLSPEGADVAQFDFDLKHGRMLLTLRPKGPKDVNTVAAMVDLKAKSPAVLLAQ